MSKELMTASECLIDSRVNFEVESTPVFDDDGDGVGDYRAIRRTDTKQVFQIAKKSYQVVQNSEAFSFFDEIVGSGQAKYDKASIYKGGGVVVLRAKVPHDFEVVPGDEVATYLQLVNSHDGSKALSIVPQVVRLVCTNGLTALRDQATRRVSCKHTISGKNRFVWNAQKVLGEERAYFAMFQEKCRKMAKEQFSKLEMDSFLATLLDLDGEKKISARRVGIVDDIRILAEEGVGQDIKGVRGTKWAAYNAVTEYVDNQRATRESGNEEGNDREYSSLFGSGADLREKAFAYLTR